MTWNRLAAVLAALAPLVHTEAQTLPLLAGTGFTWERVGNTAQNDLEAIGFDRQGTIWIGADCTAIWLDRAAGGAGVWREPSPRPPNRCALDMLLLGPHPPGGPARADTVLAAYFTMFRSVDAGRTWRPAQSSDSTAGRVVVEVPPGYPHAGRLVAGTGDLGMGYSDTRGDSWTHAVNTVPDQSIGIEEILLLPPVSRLPGVASGRGAAAPPGWPEGRVVGGGPGGVVVSDTGGAGYRATSWFGGARDGQQLALVRRLEAHPLGAGPRLLLVGTVSGDPSVSTWTSDDAGATWQRRQFLPEPQTAPGYSRAMALFALSEAGEADPGAGGRAVVMLGLGHLYETADAGETWHVVGRAPDMSTPPPPGTPYERITNVSVAEIGPDGRLYVGVRVLGPERDWLYRTTAPFAVASEAGAVEAGGLNLVVRPNPASGRVEVVLSLAAAGPVRVAVVDALGREVEVVFDGAVSAGETAVAVETGAWPAGVYVVRVVAGAQTATARLVVVR